MGMRTTRFVADFECDDDGFYYSIDGGELRGPFGDDLERERDLYRLLVAWCDRARAMGGSLYRETGGSWLVTLPEDHAIAGGELVVARAAA